MTGPPFNPVPGDSAWLEKHGIDPDVWDERGVWRYEQGDGQRVKDAVRPFIAPKPNTASRERSVASQLEWVARMVSQSPGLVMPKHAPSGMTAVPPQLRPDQAVVTDPRGNSFHYHGPWGGDWPSFPPEAGAAAGKRLPRRLVFTPEQMEDHIRKQHGGLNHPSVHRHEQGAAKYLFLPNVPQNRIDLHPRAAEIMPTADRVFFVLEGALKNDAVLSTGEAVFSVPSVTLWDHKELTRFASTVLRGKVVFVVPDADWHGNPLVDQQALFVRTLLRRAGVNAFIAAPPLSFPEKRDRSEKGIDDFLGHGYSVSDLEIRGKEAGLAVRDWRNPNLARTDESRARYALEGLSLHADEYRQHRRSLGSMMRVMALDRGRRKNAVPEVLRALGDAVEVLEGSLETEIRDWNGHKVIEWKNRPIIQLKDTYRPYEKSEMLLGDFWSEEGYATAKVAQRRLDEARRRAEDLKRLLADIRSGVLA